MPEPHQAHLDEAHFATAMFGQINRIADELRRAADAMVRDAELNIDVIGDVDADAADYTTIARRVMNILRRMNGDIHLAVLTEHAYNADMARHAWAGKQ